MTRDADSERVTRFTFGSVTGLTAAKVYEKMNSFQTQSPVPYLRYYHWAFGMYLYHRVTNSPFAHGLSTSLFILEATGVDPFGFNAEPEVRQGNMLVTASMFGLWAVLEAMQNS